MSFSFCVRSISIAHAFVLDEKQRCDYAEGRGQYGVVYATEGEAEYRFSDGKRRTVRAGELFLLSPSAAYTVHIPKVFRHYTVNFDISQDSVPPAYLSSQGCLLPASDPEYLHLFERIATLWRSPRAGSDMAAMACLYEILSLAAQGMELDGEGAARRARLYPARAYLAENFSSVSSNATLSALCQMSETHFRREWMRAFGGTPLAYRDSLRIERAKAYLLRGSLTVSAVAQECGFEDESYFSRFFKKHVGVPPGAYRRRFAIL